MKYYYSFSTVTFFADSHYSIILQSMKRVLFYVLLCYLIVYIYHMLASFIYLLHMCKIKYKIKKCLELGREQCYRKCIIIIEVRSN